MTPLAYMLRHGPQTHISEDYVSSPPALTIVDEQGDVWTLGFEYAPQGPRGEFAFDILRNGMKTGAWASRIERRGGRIRIFTAQGWRRWSGTTFV